MTEQEYEDIRRRNLGLLQDMGFRVADWLPLGPRGENDALRPLEEIAGRLWAFNVVFLYAATRSTAAPASSIRTCIAANNLDTFHTSREKAILKPWRWLSRRRHSDFVGWYLENMLSLAWILGFDVAPGLDGAMVKGELRDRMILDFIGDVHVPLSEWIRTVCPRKESDVIEREDLFYCAHNAVRNAQLGRPAVPRGFHPIIQGGVIHERRHALTWAISPGVSWNDTDLST